MHRSHHKNGTGKDPKKDPNGKFYHTRSVGKPRKRWEKVARRNALQVLII
jgi:hypothetical protein